MNKRAIENLIKAGALDGLGGTRKQFMSVYVQIADHIAHDKRTIWPDRSPCLTLQGKRIRKNSISGCRMWANTIRRCCWASKRGAGCLRQRSSPGGISGAVAELHQQYCRDFALDEETGEVQLVRDQANAVIGGLIADKTVKYTKNDKIMAF